MFILFITVLDDCFQESVKDKNLFLQTIVLCTAQARRTRVIFCSYQHIFTDLVNCLVFCANYRASVGGLLW